MNSVQISLIYDEKSKDIDDNFLGHDAFSIKGALHRSDTRMTFQRKYDKVHEKSALLGSVLFLD